MAKVNTDGSSWGNPGISGCSGILRNSRGWDIGSFSAPLGTQTSFYAELIGAILTIAITWSNGWTNLWLQCDSSMVMQAFANSKIIPWHLRNLWLNCKTRLLEMNFRVSHIFREGNCAADKVANMGLAAASFKWWQNAPH
ncbi:Ribonuclease H domain [Macleaya cordata]|uniref:Ribonuclease H domain n=1 Tax=Macleaya cordata TaxID=56857 RepID=A0A200RDS8_MACCD|nr:Ribonuclease H domain [Macleaya cordata]